MRERGEGRERRGREGARERDSKEEGDNFIYPPCACPCCAGGVVGQGTVTWQMRMFGVAENAGPVEACATYEGAVQGFSVETVTTDFTAGKFPTVGCVCM